MLVAVIDLSPGDVIMRDKDLPEDVIKDIEVREDGASVMLRYTNGSENWYASNRIVLRKSIA